MNNDNKKTFSDMLEKSNENKAKKTFSSIANEKKDELTLEDLLNKTDSKKLDTNTSDNVDESLSLTSTDIFKSITTSPTDSVTPSSTSSTNTSYQEDENKDKEVLDNINQESSNPFFNIKDDIFKEEDSPTETPPQPLESSKEDEPKEEPSHEDTEQQEETDSKPEESTESEFKEESPFFEEKLPNIDSFNNPFFDNSLNLVEDTKSTTNPTDNLNFDNIQHFDVKIVKKKEPLIKIILGVISYAIFILLLLIGITLLIYVADIKIRESKGDFSPPTYNAYVVLTGSMLPEIQVYDVVLTKKTDAENLQEGDVITFASSDPRFQGTRITHRIIKKNYDAEQKKYTFQTKGDNNNVADSALVDANNIYGKVILKIPKLGYLQQFLATDGGWIIVILIPCLAVISYDIVKLAKGLKRKKYKNIKVQKK